MTYAMLRNRLDDARSMVASDPPEGWMPWQMRDIRKTSINQAETLEEARRRALHSDPRTTARHYEVRIDGTAGKLMPRPGAELLTATDELLTKKG